MDPVLADPPAGHDDEVAGLGLLFVGRLSQDHPGHDPARPAVDQGLAGVAVVEDDGSVDGGDAALVAPVLHPFPHAFIDPFRDGGGGGAEALE